jgi:hypothetical protein
MKAATPYLMTFAPGDLGTKIIALDGGAPFNCEQRYINGAHLRELAGVPIGVLARTSDADPLVFFNQDGIRRLADGNHRLTLANRHKFPTEWWVVDRTTDDFALLGDWNAQHAAMSAAKVQTFEDRVGAMRGSGRWFDAFRAANGVMPSRSRTIHHISFRNVVNAHLMAQALEKRLLHNKMLNVGVPRKQAKLDMLALTDKPTAKQLAEIVRLINLWNHGAVRLCTERRHTSMPVGIAAGARALAIWLVLYKENQCRLSTPYMDSLPERIVTSPRLWNGERSLIDLAQYICRAANYRKTEKHRVTFGGMDYR